MTDDLCPKCGWVLGTGVASCPACGERLAARQSGFETVYYPVAAAAAGGAGGGQATVGAIATEEAAAPSSSTSLLREGDLGTSVDDLRLKTQPFLTCRGGSMSGRRLNLSSPTTTVGRKGADIVLSNIFSDVVNRIDVVKLFQQANLI